MKTMTIDNVEFKIVDRNVENKFANVVEDYIKEMDEIRSISRNGQQVFG